MANQEHLNLLEQGAEVWNRWRQEHPEIQPDLSEAFLHSTLLHNTNLSGADLRFAGLSGAFLTKSDLRNANLSVADLRSANLYSAMLSNANLHSANLRSADLSNADLSKAHLDHVDFTSAYLKETDFTQAWVGWTTFGDVDLSQVKALDTVKHHGPSTVGLDTINLSRGNIPLSFLRGAGVPNAFITYVHSLIEHPVDFYSCFISFSNQDQVFAERLHADLQNNGVRCWFAPEDLKIGDHYHQRIDESIRIYDKLILILSEHALQSAWVEREVASAREKEDHLGHEVLFPIRLDDAVMITTKAWAADVRRRWHIGDFTQWKDHDTYLVAFERLLRDLKAEHRPKG